jgi:hypothetical protein
VRIISDLYDYSIKLRILDLLISTIKGTLLFLLELTYQFEILSLLPVNVSENKLSPRDVIHL